MNKATFRDHNGERHYEFPEDTRYTATEDTIWFWGFGYPREVKGYFHPKEGRTYVALHVQGKQTSATRARVIYCCWHGIKMSQFKQHVLHINGNASEDHITNLYAGSHSDNMRDIGRHGMAGGQRLTFQDCRDIIASSKSAKELAEDYGCGVHNIWRIRRKGIEYYAEQPWEATEIRGAECAAE